MRLLSPHCHAFLLRSGCVCPWDAEEGCGAGCSKYLVTDQADGLGRGGRAEECIGHDPMFGPQIQGLLTAGCFLKFPAHLLQSSESPWLLGAMLIAQSAQLFTQRVLKSQTAGHSNAVSVSLAVIGLCSSMLVCSTNHT